MTKVLIEFGSENALRIRDIADGEFFVLDRHVWIPTGSGNPDLILSAGDLMQKVWNRNSGQREVVDVATGHATHNFPADAPLRRIRVSIKAEFV